MEVLYGLVDPRQAGVRVCDVGVQVHLAPHYCLDQPRHLVTGLPAAEGRPFHCRPVTSWKGRAEIFLPAAATPITQLSRAVGHLEQEQTF